MKFVRCAVPRNFTGPLFIRDRSWVIPSCVVAVKSGSVGVPVLNLNEAKLTIGRGKELTSAERDDEGLVGVIPDDPGPVACTARVGEDDVLGSIELGPNLTEGQRADVLCPLRNHRRCFPDGGLPAMVVSLSG